MIQAAETDIIGPAVTAEDPDGLLVEIILILQDRLCGSLAAVLIEFRALKELDKRFGSSHIGAAVVLRVKPGLCSFCHACLVAFGKNVDVLFQAPTDLRIGKIHTIAEFRIVFKQGVCPRRALPLLIHRIRCARCGPAPDGGATRRIGDIHPVAKQLGDQLCIRRFAAACACAGVLKQRSLELAAFDRSLLELRSNLFLRREAVRVIELLLFVRLCLKRLHHERLLPLHAGADICTGTAARAVKCGNSNGKLHTGHAGHRLHLHALRSVLCFLLRQRKRADDRMRADIGAEITLDAVFRNPAGRIHSDTALLKCSGALRERAVRRILEGGYRQCVTQLGACGLKDFLDELLELRAVGIDLGLHNRILGGCPRGRDIYLYCAGNAALNRSVIHGDDLFTLLAIGTGGSVLHELDSLVLWNDAGEFEECSLQDRVDAPAKAKLLRDVGSVDGIELDVILRNIALHGARQVLVELRGIPGAVEQEDAALLKVLNHLIFCHIGRIVASDKVGLVNQIGRLDRLLTKAEVGGRYAAGLFGIIGEITLRIHIGIVADNLDGVLICADGTIRAKAPEFAGMRALRGCIRILRDRQG